MLPPLDRRDALTAGLLGAACATLYAALPFVGQRQWDALMTASVLARPERVSLREVLFFAHPLVIPLTRPFAWLTADPLRAAGLREALAGAVVVALGYVLAWWLSGSRAAGVAAGLALTLAHERWRLASGGEEKEVALAFGGAFFALYLAYREGVAVRRRWRAALGAVWALACLVHLENFTLAAVLLADVFTAGAKRREAVREAGGVALWALAFGAPFFVGGAVLLGGARDPAGVARYYLEYHLSGEFTAEAMPLGERALRAYGGAREFALGDLGVGARVGEAVAVGAVVTALVARALRRAPRGAGMLFAWALTLGVHFFFYEPWDPEAWAAAELPWAALLAAGLWGAGGRGRTKSLSVALGCGAMAVLDARSLAAGRREARAVWARTGGHADAPAADVARWLDARLPGDAVVVVGERYLASYFQIYTQREPVVRNYVGRTERELRERAKLSALSMRFYAPRVGVEELERAEREGRLYLLTYDAEDALGDPVDFEWQGLRFGRWDPDAVPAGP